jgi:hypothetical protein
MVTPVGPTSRSNARNAVESDDTAGRLAPLNFTTLLIVIS